MANEISVGLFLTADKGGAKVNRSESINIDMTGDSLTHGVQSVTDSGEVLVESDILGTVGVCFVKNLDATGYITIGSTQATNHAIKLLAGESTVFRAAGSVYAMAESGDTISVEYILIET